MWHVKYFGHEMALKTTICSTRNYYLSCVCFVYERKKKIKTILIASDQNKILPVLSLNINDLFMKFKLHPNIVDNFY